MLQKETLKSKTFKLGAIAVLGGIALIVYGRPVEGIEIIMAGLGITTMRDAISKK